LLRCSQRAILQALDEDDVKCEQTLRECELAVLRREYSAASPDDAVANIDRLMDDTEAQLSCPHANQKIFQKHKCLGSKHALRFQEDLLRSLIVRPPRLIEPNSALQPRKRRELNNPLM